MAAEYIRLQGDRELRRRLRKLAGPQLRKVATRSVREALRPMLRQAKRLTPVKSGRLGCGRRPRYAWEADQARRAEERPRRPATPRPPAANSINYFKWTVADEGGVIRVADDSAA